MTSYPHQVFTYKQKTSTLNSSEHRKVCLLIITLGSIVFSNRATKRKLVILGSKCTNKKHALQKQWLVNKRSGEGKWALRVVGLRKPGPGLRHSCAMGPMAPTSWEDVILVHLRSKSWILIVHVEVKTLLRLIWKAWFHKKHRQYNSCGNWKNSCSKHMIYTAKHHSSQNENKTTLPQKCVTGDL